MQEVHKKNHQIHFAHYQKGQISLLFFFVLLNEACWYYFFYFFLRISDADLTRHTCQKSAAVSFRVVLKRPSCSWRKVRRTSGWETSLCLFLPSSLFTLWFLHRGYGGGRWEQWSAARLNLNNSGRSCSCAAVCFTFVSLPIKLGFCPLTVPWPHGVARYAAHVDPT